MEVSNMKEIILAKNVQKILSDSESRIERYSSDREWLEKWIQLWISDRIRVGVIGVTSSGKSTLINSLLGDNLLSVAVRPSSSQLVSCSHAVNRSATVYFKNGTTKKLRDNEYLSTLIMKYSDENYNQNNKEQVAQLELSTPNFDLGDDVLLVDSPGLDATGYEIHEKLTLETLLPTVDVVIFVTTVKSEIDAKMKKTLNTIGKYNCPIMIVQNMLDSVRQSVDGRKSAATVAKERLNRVHLAVEQSNIKNKEEVRVAQISAIHAMKYRCQKEHSNEETLQFKNSKYNEFVKEIKDLIELKRPDIERQRITTIVSHIDELIKAEDKRLQNVPLTVEKDNNLESLSIDISQAYDKTYSDIQTVIFELQTLYEKYFRDNEQKTQNKSFGYLSKFVSSFGQILSGNGFGENELNQLKKTAKSFEQQTVKSVSEFTSQCSRISQNLNIPTRDLWSFNGLPRMPEAEIKTKLVERSRTVKKQGFGHKVARFLTFGLYKGTETEYYTETVFDKEATMESVKRYLERLMFEYGKTLESWQEKAEATVDSINEEISLRQRAIIEKEQKALDAIEWKKTRFELVELIKQYSEFTSTLYQKQQEPIQAKREVPIEKTKNIKVPPKSYKIYSIAENYLQSVQHSSFNFALNHKKRLHYPSKIIANSTDNLTDFLYRFYSTQNISLEKETLYHLNNEMSVVCSPNELQLKELLETESPQNIFLLMNGLQMHTEFETTLRNAVESRLKANDALFMVLHDFEALAENESAIIECLRDLSTKQNNTASGQNGLTLICNNNPLYNMTLIHAQTTELLHQEEIDFLNLIKNKFPSLLNEKVEKHIASILRI